MKPLFRLVLSGGLLVFLAVSTWPQDTRNPQSAGNVPPESPPAIRYEKFKTASGSVSIVAFDPLQYSLCVIDNGSSAVRPEFTGLADAVKRSGGIAGINGGFFDPQNFSPSGLLISRAKTVAAFDPKGWQEGVLAVWKNGISLIGREDFHHQGEITDALQSSPWLLRAGIPQTALKGDSRRARRVFVATGKSGRCAIGFSTPTTFFDLSEFLRSKPVANCIDISDALALDGASSAGFYSTVEGRSVSDPEIVTVRDFVAVIPRHGRANDPSIFAVHASAFRIPAIFVLIAGALVGGWFALWNKKAP